MQGEQGLTFSPDKDGAGAFIAPALIPCLRWYPAVDAIRTAVIAGI